MTQAQRIAGPLNHKVALGHTAQVLSFPVRLKILHVDFSRPFGGSQRYGADLANRQAELGHEVHFAGAPGAAVAGMLSDKVTYHAMGLPVMRAVQLDRLVARKGIDICHGHLSPACKALGRTSGRAPTVATLHVGYKAHQHGRLDGVICVNDAQSERLGDFGGEAKIIANWTPVQKPRQRPMTLREELGLASNCLIVGGVGRLHPSKGNDLLISAFRASAPQNAALVIIGEGPQRKALERQCEGDRRIHLLGFREDVDSFLDDIDLFVSPSREESFGLAILEAMSVGLPVIATATEGPAQYLKNQPVTLIPTHSAEALAQAMGQFFDAPSRRAQYDLEDFAPTKGVTEILDFYRELTRAG